MSPGDSALRKLIDAIAHGDTAGVAQQLAASPALASAQLEDGATRSGPKTHFLEEIGHHLYAGDTALHVAAAAYRPDLVRKLVKAGANVSATNRRGAQPLHYAADGAPGSDRWSPAAQAATIGVLIEAGADPNAFNRSGVAPLHRAVRTRSAAAVKALIEGGADARLRNKSGSTPMKLARHNTGRGGSGAPEAKAQREEIVLLLQAAASRVRAPS